MSSTTTFSEADDVAPEGHEDVAPLQDVKIQIADPVEVNIGKGDVKAASVAPKIEVKEEKSGRDVLSQATHCVDNKIDPLPAQSASSSTSTLPEDLKTVKGKGQGWDCQVR